MFSPEELNRLSGDIRILDRRFYSKAFHTSSELMKIAGSLAYSIVGLQNILGGLLITILIILVAVFLIYQFSRFMTVRKEVYCSEVIYKGKMLKKIQ